MKKVFLFLASTAALVACSKGSIEQVPNEGPLQKIAVNVASFDGEEITKTAVTTGGSFTWSAGDQIGIYPLSVDEGQLSQQIIFKVEGGADAASATFTGTGWGLIANGSYSYFSYYPYSASTTPTQAVVSFSDNLTQESNSSTAHLGVNDYLYAPAVRPTDALSASLSFYHIGALVEFAITVPEAAREKTFRKVEIESANDIFMVSGKYIPSTTVARNPGAGIYGPEITDVVYTNKLTLVLNDISPDGEGKIHAYYLVGPAAVKDEELNIKLTSTDFKPYVGTKTPTKDILSQNHKIYDVDVVLAPLGEPVNLSAEETANCYVVPEYGRYKFLANVRGNGVDPVTDSEGPSIDLTDLTPFVLWETVNTTEAPAEGSIVSSVTKDGDYILFVAEGLQGNAVIALKNSSNEIVWSWHIWSTDADLDALAITYPNGAGVMMDRNLGALSNTPNDPLTLGFYYQTGRPFPIVGPCTWAGARMVTTNSSIWVAELTTEEKGTLTYSSAHPTHFLMNNPENVDGSSHIYPTDHWYWYGTLSTAPEFWPETKSMYDPCPVGWKIPNGGNGGVWDIAGFSYETFTRGNKGRAFISTEPETYYPANGLLRKHPTTGDFNMAYIGNLGHYRGAYGYSLYFTQDAPPGGVYPKASGNLYLGYGIRPCQD